MSMSDRMVTGRNQITAALMFQDIGRSDQGAVHGHRDIGRDADADYVYEFYNLIKKSSVSTSFKNTELFPIRRGEFPGYAKII